MIRHAQAGRMVVAGLVAVLSACSSGGGGDNTPAPTVQLSAQPSTNVAVGESTTLSWSSTNTDTCQASGGWSGTKFVSGSETVGPLNATTAFNLACTGRGGSATASATVTIAGGNTVAGQLLVPATSRSDSDVNDPFFEPFARNDTVAEAQVMPNPVVIGGFVSVPGTAPEGRLQASGDLRDLYRVNLVAGQVIELLVPSARPVGSDDADLRLLDSSGTLVNAPVEGDQREQLIVAADGAYLIEVEVDSGAPLYLLSVGQTGIVSSAGSVNLSDDFVPGEVLVTMKTAGQAATSATAGDAMLATRYGTRRKGGAPDRAMRLALPSKARVSAAAKRPWRFASDVQERKLDTLLYVERLRRDPDVRSADVNRVMRTSLEPNDLPGYPVQRWHYRLIQLPDAWDLTTGGAIRVAVVDTGVVAHPDLSSKFVDGYDFITIANPDGTGIDSDPTDPGCGVSGGSIFHGTHVAGTIGAVSNNGTGVAGVSWGARIMPIRALDGCTGSGTTSDIIEGIRYAARLSNDSGTLPAQRAAVINMSFGSSGACDAILQDQLDQVRAQGVVLVAAAGNDASNSVQTPASCQNVINVASVGPLRTRAPYSNFGDTVDVAAPGGDMSKDVNGDGLLDGIYSTHATGGGTATVFTLELLQGTSMAAPHVSGVIALMLSRNSQLTPAEIDAHLGLGSLTDDLGDTSLGKGLINARKAIAAVDPNLPPLPPNLSVTPSSLAFGDIGTTADVVATNGGGGTLVISPPTSSEPWLSVTAKAVDGNGLGTYSVAVDRTGLQEGSYSGVVEFTSNDGTEQIEVLMEVSLVPGDPNAGEQYVLLLNPVTFENLAQVQVRADDDAVDYVFQGVAADEYIVISGTDLNNDGFICDPAEACGAYPVESQPEPIVVQGDVTGRDFVVAYRAGLTINASSTGAAKVLRPKLRPRRIDK